MSNFLPDTRILIESKSALVTHFKKQYLEILQAVEVQTCIVKILNNIKLRKKTPQK